MSLQLMKLVNFSCAVFHKNNYYQHTTIKYSFKDEIRLFDLIRCN